MAAARSDAAVITLSTSGIYPRTSGIVEEATYGNSALDQSLLAAEQAAARNATTVTTLRLGGLCGPGRIPGSWYQGRQCDVGNDHSNYVHSADVVEAIMACTALRQGRRTYNIVSPDHPLKREVFARMAERYGFAPPMVGETPGSGRIISSALSQLELGLHYAYPSPLSY